MLEENTDLSFQKSYPKGELVINSTQYANDKKLQS
jgi:hypothetical protein